MLWPGLPISRLVDPNCGSVRAWQNDDGGVTLPRNIKSHDFMAVEVKCSRIPSCSTTGRHALPKRKADAFPTDPRLI